jgi:hypothetical protein
MQKIAAAPGISIPVAKVRLFRARRRLRQVVNPVPPAAGDLPLDSAIPVLT